MARNAPAQSAIPTILFVLPATDPVTSHTASPTAIPTYTRPAYTRPMYSDPRR